MADLEVPGESNPQEERLIRVHQLRRSGLTEREIADQTADSQPTVHRLLQQKAVKPIGHTKKGTPFYSPDRFSELAGFNALVDEFKSEMSRGKAKLTATRIYAQRFDGPFLKSPERMDVAERLAVALEYQRIAG